MFTNTREYIIGECLKLFLKKGFRDVTLKEIVHQTGLSKGAFYHYFTSKEQLFNEILETFFSYLIVFHFEQYSTESLYRFYHDHIQDLEKALGKFSADQELIRDSGEDTFNFLYPLFDALRLLPGYREQISKARQKEFNHWVQAIERARQSGEIRSNMSSEQIALLFIYSGNGIGLQNIMEAGTGQSMIRAYTDLWDSFYNNLKA